MNTVAEILKKHGHTCQEASPFSGAIYIPCGAPATKIVWGQRAERPYLMCDGCASHNVNNRGGVLLDTLK
jgi:hypothetical protein